VERLAEHRIEVTRPTDPRRRFRRIESLALPDSTCVVLTDAGYQWASRFPRLACGAPDGCATLHRHPASSFRENLLLVRRPTTPTWDARLRELRLGERLVKRFNHPAPAQEEWH
jgi:hypothetical protein